MASLSPPRHILSIGTVGGGGSNDRRKYSASPESTSRQKDPVGSSPIFKSLFAKPPSTGNHPHSHCIVTSIDLMNSHCAYPSFLFSNSSPGSLPSLDSSSQPARNYLHASDNEPGLGIGQGLTSSAKSSTKNQARRASRHSLDHVDLLGISPTVVAKPSGDDNDPSDSMVKSLTVTGVGSAVSSEFRRASSFKASSMLTALFGTVNDSTKSNNDHLFNDDSSHSRGEGELGLRHGLPSSDSIDERIRQNTTQRPAQR